LAQREWTLATLGNLGSKPALVALLGLAATVILIARKVKGAILFIARYTVHGLH